MTDAYAIAIILPVLSRPHRVKPLLDSIRATTTVPHRILFICSPGDYDEIAAIEREGADYLRVPWMPGPGDYAKKINFGYRHTTEPYIFTGADDLQFHPRWDIEALSVFQRFSRVGVVGTNDLGNNRVLSGQHATHSLVARWYADNSAVFDQPHAIYSEEYVHEFLDDELVQVAKLNRAWAFSRTSVVEHLHPYFDKAPTDALYDQAPKRLPEGRAIYSRRRKLWLMRARQGRRRG